MRRRGHKRGRGGRVEGREEGRKGGRRTAGEWSFSEEHACMFAPRLGHVAMIINLFFIPTATVPCARSSHAIFIQNYQR